MDTLTFRVVKHFKAPLGYVIAVLLGFVVWIAPSTHSQWWNGEAGIEYEWHRVSLGVLFYAEMTAVRHGADDSWRVSYDLGVLRLLGTLLASMPIFWLGRLSLRRHAAQAAPAG